MQEAVHMQNRPMAEQVQAVQGPMAEPYRTEASLQLAMASLATGSTGGRILDRRHDDEDDDECSIAKTRKLE